MSRGTIFIGGSFGNGGGQGNGNGQIEGVQGDSNLVSKTYAQLKALRDQGKLVAGAYYRITDYMATTGSYGTVAINDLPFDIIVTATSESTLSENAMACERDGYEYDQYLKPDFRAWQLKYCLDNDITRFGWADETDGKGVVYRLIDEHNNSVGYDYKNIGFDVEFFRSLDTRIGALAESEGFNLSTANYIRLYSVQLQDGSVADASVFCKNLPNSSGEEIGVRNNYIGDIHFGNNYVDIPFAAFLNGYDDGQDFAGIVGTTCKGQSMRDLSCGSGLIFAAGRNCSHWTAGANCTSFVVYANCSYWTAGDLNFDWTAGADTSYWTTGAACYGWSAGRMCADWSAGEYCHSWRTGDNCSFWSAGNGSHGWSVGAGCSHWTVGNNCSGWSTGNSCHSWLVGHSSEGWKVGNQSSSWLVSDNCDGWEVGDNCNRWQADSGCSYWKVANRTRSFHILSAVKFSELTQLPVVANKDYTQLVALRKDGTVRVWCPDEDNAIVDVAILPTANIDRTVLYRTLTHRYWHGGEEIQKPVCCKSLSDALVVSAAGLTYTPVGGESTTTAWADVADEVFDMYLGTMLETATFDEACFFKLGENSYCYKDDVTEESVYQLWHNPTEEAGKYIEVTNDGTDDYNDLENKPSINGVELDGNKTSEQLGIVIPKRIQDDPTGSGVIEGIDTTASGQNSHAEGMGTEASGEASHAEGFHTKANRAYQHVFGKYNKVEQGDSASEGHYVEIVGNGTGDTLLQRKNARTLSWDGKEWLADTLEVSREPELENEVATKAYVDGNVMERVVVDEEKLIGEWVEGGVTYDLYEKVVAFGALPNNASKAVAHGVSDKVRFVNTKGFAYGSNNLSIPFVNADGSLFIYMGVGNTQITITTNSDRSGLTGYVYLTFIRSKE